MKLLKMVKNMIRGGASSVFDKRIFTANNKSVGSHDFHDFDSYGLLIDANNLDGGIVEKFPKRADFQPQIDIGNIEPVRVWVYP